jgi:hypothetical protein
MKCKIENGKWKIAVLPSAMIGNRAQSAHHNFQISILNFQFFIL